MKMINNRILKLYKSLCFQGDTDTVNKKPLASLDRTQGLPGRALNLCCICTETLYIPGDKSMFSLIST